MQEKLPSFVDDFVSQKLYFDEKQKEKLVIWHDLLHKWQKKINLISPKTVDESWHRHFMDSLQLGLYLPVEENMAYGDIGSGAGFPGLAIALISKEPMLLIESDQKKCSFLRSVIREWGEQDRITIANERIEKLTDIKLDVVSARALASLHQLFLYSLPLLKDKAYALFLKGENWENEIKEAQENWFFDYEAKPSLSHEKAMILKVTNIKEKV